MIALRAFGDELSRTARLSIPLALGQLGQVLFGVVVTMAIGARRPDLLAAGGLAVALHSTAIVVCGGGLCSGVAIVVAQCEGREDSAHVLRTALKMSTIVSVTLLPLAWFSGTLLELSGQSIEVASGAQSLLRAASWGIPGAVAFAVLRNFAAGTSRAGSIPIVSIAVTGGFALASAVIPWQGLSTVGHLVAASQWALALAMAARFRLHINVDAVARPSVVGALLRLGAPVAIMFALEAGFFSATSLLVGRFGANALAAHQIVAQTCYLTFMVPSGIGIATSVRVARATAAHDRKSVLRASAAGFALAASYMALSTIVLYAFRDVIISVYLGGAHADEVRSTSRSMLAIAAAFQVADGVQGVAGGALRGRGLTGRAAIAGIAAYWFAGMGVAFAASRSYGPLGVWWGIASGLVAAAVALGAMFFADVLRRS